MTSDAATQYEWLKAKFHYAKFHTSFEPASVMNLVLTAIFVSDCDVTIYDRLIKMHDIIMLVYVKDQQLTLRYFFSMQPEGGSRGLNPLDTTNVTCEFFTNPMRKL